MRSSREASTTESRQPTVRALPLVELDAKLSRPRASDVHAGAPRGERRAPAVARASTLPLPRAAAARAVTVTQLHGPGSLTPPSPSTQLHGPSAALTPPSPSTQLLGAPPSSASLAPGTTPPTPLELAGSVRAYVDPASASGVHNPHAITPARASLTPVSAGRPLVQVRTFPALHFSPIEKGILILAGFSVVAVVISTIFHG